MLDYVKIIGLLPRKSHKEKECKKLEKDQCQRVLRVNSTTH